MKHAPLVALICLSCATAERQVDRQCRLQGRRFVAEARGMDGLAPVAAPTVPRADASDVTGGAHDPEPYGARGEGTIGLGNLGLIGKRPPPPLPDPEGLILGDVQLGHAELGRGGTVDGIAHYRQHRDAKVILEASASVDGHGWKMDVPGRERAYFWLRCLEGRPRHTVEWTFQLRDADGHRSNAVTRRLVCTGEPLPGAAPRLEAAEIAPSDVVLGWGTGLLTRVSGTHPPLEVIARSQTRGYSFRGLRVSGGGSIEGRSSLTCSDDRGIHSVRWEISVRDSYGRESNVITRTMNCGVCQ